MGVRPIYGKITFKIFRITSVMILKLGIKHPAINDDPVLILTYLTASIDSVTHAFELKMLPEAIIFEWVKLTATLRECLCWHGIVRACPGATYIVTIQFKSTLPKPLDQPMSNFLMRINEREKLKFTVDIWVTRPRWLQRTHMFSIISVLGKIPVEMLWLRNAIKYCLYPFLNEY